MPTVSDTVWSAADTTPSAIEAAMRDLLKERHSEDSSYVPARVLNLVVVVDSEWSGEIANRLSGVGRLHPSRTVVCSVETGRTTLDAVCSVASDTVPKPGEFALTRESVIIRCGPGHLAHLDSIVDPLVVTDLATVVWAPHGHPEAVDSLLGMSQVVLLDSVDEPEPGEALQRAAELSERVYVVDLAWLRSTPWRERVAATFDPPAWRPALERIAGLTVTYHPDSAVAGLLLFGWLGSRLGWRMSPLISQGGDLHGKAQASRAELSLCLKPNPRQSVRGLSGLTIEMMSGTTLSLERGSGGLRAVRRDRKGDETEWTVLGASRGEGGILGNGIRQALLRDSTYGPALDAARQLL